MYRITGPIQSSGSTLKNRPHTSADVSHRPALEQAAVERLHAGETKILEMIARGKLLPEVLDALARFIESQADGIHCSISFVDGEFRIRPTSAPTLPSEYNGKLDGVPIFPYIGPCGMAAYMKRQVISESIEADDRWSDGFRSLTREHGLKACWSTPIFDSQGSVTGTFAIFAECPCVPTALHSHLIEIATRLAGIAIERQRKEERLHLYAEVISRSTEAVRISDHDDRIAEQNAAHSEMFGLTDEELKGQSSAMIFGEEQSARVRAIQDENDQFNGELVTTTHGHPRLIDVSVFAVKDHDKKTVCYVALSRDVTEKRKAENALKDSHAALESLVAQRTAALQQAFDKSKRAEDELRRSEAFLAEGQNLGRVGNFSWLVETNEIRWSEQLYRTFEFEREVTVTLELIGSRVHPEDLPLMNDMIEKAQHAASDFEYAHRLLMPDGSIKHMHLIAHASRDREGRLEYIGAVQDVTQRRLSEEALSKARSELARVTRITSLGVLTASIAHEVNQPLLGIITNASTCLRMLSADPPNVDGARETARRTIRDGNRVSDVISRLRMLYSEKNPQPKMMDLNEATREVMSLSLSDLQRNQVIVRHEFAENLHPITGDRVQLQQVIMNLLRNASEAMATVNDRARELLIRTEQDEDDCIRLSVKDAGVGFSPQTTDKLFDAFFTTKSHGMGIGLSISRSIIEAHHGRLWATANDGPGATFSFSIPCRLEALLDAESGVNRADPTTNAA
jgi:PAS domain S-box-containing protein